MTVGTALVVCSNVDDLLNSYTSSLLNVLDTIAPVKVRMVKSRQRAPWRKEESVMAQKRECRTEMAQVKTPDSL